MRASRAAAAALYAAGVSAATTSFCASNQDSICFQWGVPEVAASSGSGNVYFQLRGPTEYAWVGLGIGSRMAGAEIFLMYQDGNGNVTLSTRAGEGHVMPQYTERSDVELLEGSGVSDGQMIANVRCGSCSSLELAGQNSWIAAWSQGDSLASTSPSEPISVHDDNTVFSVDFAQAAVSSDANPFVGSNAGDGTGNEGGNDGGSSGNGNGSDSDSGSGSNSGSGGGGVQEVVSDNTNTLVLAHGIVMTIVFVGAYPLGSMLMPLLGKWYIHAAWQTLAFLGMWAGFALGYVVAERDGYVSYFTTDRLAHPANPPFLQWWQQTHTKMGTVVVALLGLQPVLGWIHHQHYMKHQKRGAFSYIHISYGQVLIIVGIVNGGLGLQLAGASNAYIIAYSVLAGVFTLLYAGVSVMRHSRRQARPPRPTKGSRDGSIE
ncbi:hypothetical protein HJFPF1_00859 [Paramyrothecium foliicola]|nr:hypothetical protein HJFPF1_00859 [Paramyrothecium foliicola]